MGVKGSAGAGPRRLSFERGREHVGGQAGVLHQPVIKSDGAKLRQQICCCNFPRQSREERAGRDEQLVAAKKRETLPCKHIRESSGRQWQQVQK